ncbi:MAG TPA: hypothetical protein VG368_00975 [Acidimicrobiales bacterium]|jgi:hypothetical protein|nr:hypothetical protein [Acidimicrobiales bacterium]
MADVGLKPGLEHFEAASLDDLRAVVLQTEVLGADHTRLGDRPASGSPDAGQERASL